MCGRNPVGGLGCGATQTMTMIFIVMVVATILCLFAHRAAWNVLQFICDDVDLARLRLEWRAVHCDLNHHRGWGCSPFVSPDLTVRDPSFLPYAIHPQTDTETGCSHR